jgi:hypothetical protein
MEQGVLAGRAVECGPHGAGVRSSAPGDPHDLDPERAWLHALRRLLARQDGQLSAAADGRLDRERPGAVAMMWLLASLLIQAQHSSKTGNP